MAEMIKMRTGNHKAEWSEDALIILEEFATAKVQGRGGACGRILPYRTRIDNQLRSYNRLVLFLSRLLLLRVEMKLYRDFRFKLQ